MEIEADRGKLARYGVNVSDLQEVVEMAIGGKEASKVYEGQKVFSLSVRFPESARNDVEPVRNILISASKGALIPLGELAKVYIKERPAQISREMAQRRIVIECNVVGRDIGSFVGEAEKRNPETVGGRSYRRTHQFHLADAFYPADLVQGV